MPHGRTTPATGVAGSRAPGAVQEYHPRCARPRRRRAITLGRPTPEAPADLETWNLDALAGKGRLAPQPAPFDAQSMRNRKGYRLMSAAPR